MLRNLQACTSAAYKKLQEQGKEILLQEANEIQRQVSLRWREIQAGQNMAVSKLKSSRYKG